MKAEEEEGERGGEEEEEEGEMGKTEGERGGEDGEEEGEVNGEGEDLRLQSGVERRENAPESISDESEEEEEWQALFSSSSSSLVLSSSFFNLFSSSAFSSSSTFFSPSSSPATRLCARGSRKSSSNLAITSSAVSLSLALCLLTRLLLAIIICLPQSSSQMSESCEDLALPRGFLPFDEGGLGEEEALLDCLLDCGVRLRRERARVLGKERRPCLGRRREEMEERLDCLLLPICFVVSCLLLLFVCLPVRREAKLSCLLLPCLLSN